VLHVDHVAPGNFYLHLLNTPRGKFSLHFAGKAPNLWTGERVRVRGTKVRKGTYAVSSTATKGASSVTSTTSFVVQ
jgi:hypothetical protein